MKIREATKQDIEPVQALFTQLDTHAITSQPEHFRPAKRSEEYLLEIINGENSDFLLVEQNGQVIAFASISIKDTPDVPVLIPFRYTYIMDFVVREDWRNQGIGGRLMESIKIWAQERGATRLRLGVLPDNLGAQHFYVENGFYPQMITMEATI